MKNRNTYKLTEGAILLAIFAVLLLISLYVPGLGLVATLFMPLPFMMFAAKNDGKSAAVFTVAAVLISLIFGTLLAIPLALAHGSTGAVMGYMISKGKGRLAIFVAGSLVFLVNTVLQYAAAVALFKINFIDEMLAAFRESISMSAGMMERMGQTVDDGVMEQLEGTVELMETLMPSMFVLASFLIVFLVQLVSIPILKRFGIDVSRWKPFRELRLPKSVLWYYLFSLISSMLISPDTGGYWVWAVTNLLFVLQFLILLQGFSLIAYFYHVKGYSKAIFVVTVILALLIPILLYIVRILGIIDLGFDLRKRLEEKK
ncbi:membrane protein [Mesobacillus campisalis]|uniref:Membrane protein n=1 Tax=Mesobacillus campisalis TaxID=1408103 RepID=A0A0M2SQN3_9BACI|nr:YybS family protein [Mesobacillus campisalis]KKK36854.1 membrane protein [Mesobacillus campisalis]